MDNDLSFSSLFHEIQNGSITTIVSDEYLARAQLERVYVGRLKDDLNVVETSHSVFGVCGLFGSFIKFVVSCPAIDDLVGSIGINGPQSKRDGSDDMKLLPSIIAEPKNRKEKLYNDIISFLSESQLGWINDPAQYGKPFVTELCNVLWFVDGHHGVLSSRSCPIPSLFTRFNGYNRPELSKHRKRSISNLSREKYRICVQSPGACY